MCSRIDRYRSFRATGWRRAVRAGEDAIAAQETRSMTARSNIRRRCTGIVCGSEHYAFAAADAKLAVR
jgi:hypothetical protein